MKPNPRHKAVVQVETAIPRRGRASHRATRAARVTTDQCACGERLADIGHLGVRRAERPAELGGARVVLEGPGAGGAELNVVSRREEQARSRRRREQMSHRTWSGDSPG